MHYRRNNNKFNAKQYGFVPQKSIEYALHSRVSNIKEAFNRKGFMLSIAADIRDAFDHGWWPKILQTLQGKRCPKNLFLLSKSYFSERTAKLSYLNAEVVRKQTTGCPQGIASRLWFWNESFDDIFRD